MQDPDFDGLGPGFFFVRFRTQILGGKRRSGRVGCLDGKVGEQPGLILCTQTFENAYTCDRNVAMRLHFHTSARPDRTARVERWAAVHEYETHRVPLGAVVLDAKYCEFCGCNFLRRAFSEDRYCSNCLLTILTVNGQESELIH